MEYWTVICLGLPILYMTGSLRHAVASAGLSGRAFVLFFLCAAVLDALPPVRTPGGSVCIAGVFMSAAPIVYLAAKRRARLSFWIACIFSAASGALIALVFESMPIPYNGLVLAAPAAAASLLAGGARAPVYAPAAAGVSIAAAGAVDMMMQRALHIVWMDGVGVCAACAAACLFLAYYLARLRRKHMRGAAAIQSNQTDTESSQPRG